MMTDDVMSLSESVNKSGISRGTENAAGETTFPNIVIYSKRSTRTVPQLTAKKKSAIPPGRNRMPISGSRITRRTLTAIHKKQHIISDTRRKRCV